ncbi:serine/threonine protein kinase [Leifsonia sp. EB41]|uniref:serine/threonine-protein kinase n=1 Tax=Leifsonia sp. EB41 TaxID=3156260 RepID=UPI003518B26E
MSATGRTPAAAPDAGRIADRYRLLERIGSGGMAEVFRAHDELLGRDVALKVFRREFASADDLRRQKGEVKLLANLSHPALVTLFDTTSDDEGRGVLVLEFVDGTDAGARLKEGPLPEAAVAALAVDVARALAYIHGRGVVHRDIAPANILLPSATSSGVHAKLTDLGIARLIDDARITSTGFVIGTASYLSPEQAAGRPVGPPSDVYSLGLVLLECLTGTREFPGSGVESAVARLSRDPDVPDTLDPEWRRLIRSMVAREPDHRPTAAVVAEELAGLLARDAAPADADEGLERTLLLPSPDESPEAQVAQEAPEPTAATVILPGARPEPVAPRTTAVTSRMPRPLRGVRRGILGILLACAALIVVVIGIALGAMIGGGQPPPDPVKSYPAVGGTLGDHLKQLEHDVSNSGP